MDNLAIDYVEMSTLCRAQKKEIERLRRLILMGRLWDEAPCCLCGYNGRGYFQPETHKCAKDYEEIFKEGG